MSTGRAPGSSKKVADRVLTNPDLKPEHVYSTVFKPDMREPMASPGQYRVLRGVVTFQSNLILGLLFCTIICSVVFADQYIYHVAILDKEGLPEKVQQLLPLEEPNLTRTAITNMAMNVATEVMTFGFNNSDERLLRARRLFTDEAWQRFAKAYLSPGRLDKIKGLQQILTTIATNGAVISEEGEWAGRYRWVVQVPIVTTYQAGKRLQTQYSTLELTFVRAPTTKHPEGVAIDAWAMI